MTDQPGEKRKRANDVTDDIEPEEKKPVKRVKKIMDPSVLSMTEDEVLDPENDRSLQDRKDWLEFKTVKGLADMCAAKGLKKGGKKDELVSRLLDTLNKPASSVSSSSSSASEAELADSLPAPSLANGNPAHHEEPHTIKSSSSPEAAQSSPARDIGNPHKRLHRKKGSPSSTTNPNLRAVERNYTDSTVSTMELVDKHLRPKSLRFKKDLADLHLEQTQQAYCLLAQLVQDMAHNSTPCLELKDPKKLEDTESRETAFMAMETLDSNIRLLHSMEWHNRELDGQRQIVSEQEGYIKKLEAQRLDDYNTHAKEMEKLSSRLSGVQSDVSMAKVPYSAPAATTSFALRSSTTRPQEAEEPSRIASPSGAPPPGLSHQTDGTVDSPSNQNDVDDGKTVGEMLFDMLTPSPPPPQQPSATTTKLPGLGLAIADSQDDDLPDAPAARARSRSRSPAIKEPPFRASASPIRLAESPLNPRDTDDVHPSSGAGTPASAALLRPVPPPPPPTSTPAMSPEQKSVGRAARDAPLLNYDDEDMEELFEDGKEDTKDKGALKVPAGQDEGEESEAVFLM